MTSYQQQHQQQNAGRRTDNDVLHDVRSLDSSWIITELARAVHENVFSDTVSSPLSVTRQSASPDSELWAEQLRGLPASMIRFPTHDGRGGFTLAMSSRQSSDHESAVSRHTAIVSQSLRSPSLKVLSIQASTSSSILDDALPGQPYPSTELSQRIHAWAQEQQRYARLRSKRRRLPGDTDQRIQSRGLEGWIWRFVSRLIGLDDQILQIVLGQRLIESAEKNAAEGSSLFWEKFLRRTAMEKLHASPFPSPHFQQMFRKTHELTSSSSTPTSSRPVRPAPTPWDKDRRPVNLQLQPKSSWSSLPPDPIQTAPFQPTPIRLTQSQMTESSHAPWGIEDNDVLSTSTEVPDDYWDREFTFPIVWHIVKNFVSTRLPHKRQRSEEALRSCKEESIHGRWDDPEERGYYWHESVDGASSLGLGLGGLGTWAEV